MTKPDPLPASAHANRPYGSGMRGIQLFFSSPLVDLEEEFSSPALARMDRTKVDGEKGESEKDRWVLLGRGRHDLLLSGTSSSPLFCQILTRPYGETAHPSVSAGLTQSTQPTKRTTHIDAGR